MTSKIFSDKSNCRRAAKKALGDAAFKISPLGTGFVWEAIDENDLPASRFPAPASDALVNDLPPGFKRLRASEGAEEIRPKGTLNKGFYRTDVK